MEIIDFHQHCALPPVQLLEVMARHNIVKSIQIPLDFGEMSWRTAVKCAGMGKKGKDFCDQVLKHTPQINQAAWNQIKTSDRFEFVPWLSTLTPMDAVIHSEWFQTARIAKFIPVFDEVDELYVPTLARIISSLPQEIIMIHTGWGTSPALFSPLIADFPKKTFVLAHMKEDDDATNFERIAMMKQFSNMYLETSYLSSPKRIAQYVKMGFGDRMLFGSDFRNLDDEPTLKWFIAAIQLADISEEHKKAILYYNAARLLKLE